MHDKWCILSQSNPWEWYHLPSGKLTKLTVRWMESPQSFLEIPSNCCIVHGAMLVYRSVLRIPITMTVVGV